MYKFGSNVLKLLKMLHIVLIVLFLGGILSSYALTLNLNLSDFDQVYLTYKSLGIISDDVVKIGALGTIGLGLVYGFFTRWGFVKHKWLAVKWVVFIAQTFIGILVVDKLRVANMMLLETHRVATLSDPVFIDNHYLRQYVVIVQIILTLTALVLSVTKPGRTRSNASEAKLPGITQKAETEA
ncbi:MAG: DUF2269 domain-containing protein [Chloroflexi bacterium]|nr:DUF2269 domain-containing protein [Chloroflexota bacterium]